MKTILGLLFLVSCAQVPLHEEAPSWVTAVRQGEETLKVAHGSKTYYRRIAGSPQFTKEVSCQLAVMRAEEDIKKEFPHADKVPYALEVVFYDHTHRDCAVTASVNAVAIPSKVERTIASDDQGSEDAATELLQLRAEVASRFALTGMTVADFEKFSKEKVALNNEEGICSKYFRTTLFSVHGSTQVCWRGENVVGYCTLKDSQCWTKTP